MKQNSIEELPALRNENYENIFNIYTDEDGRYYYNLLQTIALPQNLPAGYYTTYDVKYGDTWPFISYKLYNTPNLWWIITAANNISDPTSLPEPGSQIKYFKTNVVRAVLNQISSQKNND